MTVFFKSPYNLEIIDSEIPKINVDEVLIRVIYAGLCGTDIAIYSNKAAFEIDYPIICGHEWSGIVEKIGKNVKCLKIGDRVVGECGVSCGNCIECLSGNYLYCKNLKSVGTSKLIWDGAFREYTIMPERHLYKIPESVTFLDACLAEPGVIALSSIEKVGVNIGDTVVVSGAGIIGMLCAKYAKLRGAGIIILIGRNDRKLKIAKETGADFIINIKNENMFEKIEKITNGKEINLSIEASGNIQALKNILKVTDRFGKVSIPGSYSKPLKELDLGNLGSKDLTIRVIGCSGGNDFNKILWLMNLKKIVVEKLITEIFDLDDIEEAIKLHLSPNNSIKTIIRIDKNFKE